MRPKAEDRKSQSAIDLGGLGTSGAFCCGGAYIDMQDSLSVGMDHRCQLPSRGSFPQAKQDGAGDLVSILHYDK
ncbi:hypothetical protein C8261_06680 [Pseudothauera lacus]|uniref:Uncharacterized protein n=1 Tax=Pseudothauera lacus TaxID=2136175 RepID=A0A2T4IH15_9RHOO|nr:hypothetical protein C8261_06680 [Pseudothauera lacus]